MPIILKSEKRQSRTRIVHIVLYTMLALGAVTMVYPFLLMTSGSFKSKVDVQDLSNFRIVISPQCRCQQSASIICEQIGVSFSDCTLEEDLREHCFGLWEGKTEEEIEKEFPGYLAKRYVPENYWNYVVPMGESYALLSKRVQKVIEKYKGQNVIFVCHEMVSKVMRGSVLNLTNEEVLSLGHPQDTVYKIEGGQLSELRRDDR